MSTDKMISFTPKIKIITGFVRGYGGPDRHSTRGVYDNRRLYFIEGTEAVDVAVRGERERVKWEREWSSQAEFQTAIGTKELDAPLCDNCGQPTSSGATQSLDKIWCQRPECRSALETAIAEARTDRARREVEIAEQLQRQTDERLQRNEAATTSAFHWRDGWHFRRQTDGSVRVFRKSGEWLSPDVTIPALEWASIVCSVSADGETAERWNTAQDFHGRASPPTEDTKP